MLKVLFILTLALVALGAPLGDLITRLPGQPRVVFKQYGGYVPISESKALYYYFVEATQTPRTKPVTLWLNGGPGCSSIGGGGFSENGPFMPTQAPSGSEGLFKNPGSWNKVSNMLFVDSPVGVGWSYSNSSEPEVYNDKKTSRDLLKFLLGWFSKFPEYQSNEFYITGESYAGHYAPHLAARILDFNERHGPYFNLKGMAIGNPALNETFDFERAIIEFQWSHGLVSQATYDGVLANCWGETVTKDCYKYERAANDEPGSWLNPYDILLDVCRPQENRLLKMRAKKKAPALESIAVDICIDGAVFAYLNRPDVQAALHANRTGMPDLWAECGNDLNYSNLDLDNDMIPVLEDLITRGLRILLYSGDSDSVVPFIGTRRIFQFLVNKLGLNETSRHSPWYSGEPAQIGGWTQANEGLTFATVRGAGHLVPYTSPERALDMFKAFIEGKGFVLEAEMTPPNAPPVLQPIRTRAGSSASSKSLDSVFI